jgi:hypothetical protein
VRRLTMTTDKARKRATRERMSKTDERYVAARRHTVAKLPPRVQERGPSDAAVRSGSGKTWDEWFRLLDAWDATTRSHRDIARWLRDQHHVAGWWAQTVTVGYERARGKRARNQTTRGYEVGVQRTMRAPASRVAAAFTQARQRNRWLDPGTLRARSSKPSRAAADFDADDGSRVTVYLVEKPGATAVQVMHAKLSGADDVDQRRAFWRERLEALGELLGG